jgi:hypothetical protein
MKLKYHAGVIMDNLKIYHMIFAEVYPLYVQKAERKGRTKEDVNKIINWMTGYGERELEKVIKEQHTIEYFFIHAPQLNDNLYKIKGKICGYDLDEISDPIVQNVRYLDKLIDELAKGKPLEKIMRV